MFALIYVLLMISFISAMLAVNINANTQQKEVLEQVTDSVATGFSKLEQAYRGYRKANESWEPPDEHLREPQTFSQIVPAYGFVPSVPLSWVQAPSTWSFTPVAEGSRPYFCLQANPESAWEMESLRSGALKANAVFSVSANCNTQVMDVYPSAFPVQVAITYYL